MVTKMEQSISIIFDLKNAHAYQSSLGRNQILYTVQETFTAEYPSHALDWIIINEFSLMEVLLDQKYELHSISWRAFVPHFD